MVSVVEAGPLRRSLRRGVALVGIGPTDHVALAGFAITTASTSTAASAPPPPPTWRIGRVVARGLTPTPVVVAGLAVGPGRLEGGFPAEIIPAFVE